MRAVLTALLIVVEVVTAIMLISVILIQKTKSQGMGLAFGSGMGESLFGAQIGNVITKITVILAIVFLANTALLAVLQSGSRQESMTESIAVNTPVTPAQQQAPLQQPPTDMPATAIPEGSVLDVDATETAEAVSEEPVEGMTEAVEVPAVQETPVPDATVPETPTADSAEKPVEEAAGQ